MQEPITIQDVKNKTRTNLPIRFKAGDFSGDVDQDSAVIDYIKTMYTIGEANFGRIIKMANKRLRVFSACDPITPVDLYCILLKLREQLSIKEKPPEAPYQTKFNTFTQILKFWKQGFNNAEILERVDATKRQVEYIVNSVNARLRAIKLKRTQSITTEVSVKKESEHRLQREVIFYEELLQRAIVKEINGEQYFIVKLKQTASDILNRREETKTQESQEAQEPQESQENCEPQNTIDYSEKLTGEQQADLKEKTLESIEQLKQEKAALAPAEVSLDELISNVQPEEQQTTDSTHSDSNIIVDEEDKIKTPQSSPTSSHDTITEEQKQEKILDVLQ